MFRSSKCRGRFFKGVDLFAEDKLARSQYALKGRIQLLGKCSMLFFQVEKRDEGGQFIVSHYGEIGDILSESPCFRLLFVERQRGGGAYVQA